VGLGAILVAAAGLALWSSRAPSAEAQARQLLDEAERQPAARLQLLGRAWGIAPEPMLSEVGGALIVALAQSRRFVGVGGVVRSLEDRSLPVFERPWVVRAAVARDACADAVERAGGLPEEALIRSLCTRRETGLDAREAQVSDVDGDGTAEIVLLRADGRRTLHAPEVPLPEIAHAPPVEALAAAVRVEADVDGDGDVEQIGLPAADGRVEVQAEVPVWLAPGGPVHPVELDGDPGMELLRVVGGTLQLIGVGEVPAAPPRGRVPQPPPDDLPPEQVEAWRRAVELVSMDLPLGAAEAFEALGAIERAAELREQGGR
jgi:hypothetical protein